MWSSFSRIQLAAGRMRIARRRFERGGARAFRAPLRGMPAGYWVLVHPSTAERGHWQATLFDARDEPFSDSSSASWGRLVEHVALEVDWHAAQEIDHLEKKEREGLDNGAGAR